MLPYLLPTTGSLWFTQGLGDSLYGPYVAAGEIKMLHKQAQDVSCPHGPLSWPNASRAQGLALR